MIPVCYSSNSKIFHGIVLSVLSMLERTNETVTIYLLTMDLRQLNEKFKPITTEQAKALDNIVKVYNKDNSVVLLDKSREFLDNFGKSKNLKSGFTPYCITRLLLDLCEVPQKIIYVDVDTMFCGDVAELYNIDVTDYEFAAVLDVVGRHWVRPSYCNSGVLLLNFDKIKQTGLFEKARHYVNKRKLFMPDQSALNFKCKHKLILPNRFNEQRKIKPDTIIKHFCQAFKWYGPFFTLYNYKQWDRDLVHEKLGIHDFDTEYELYDKYNEKYKFLELC